MAATIEERVNVAVDAWLRWVPGWAPGTHRGRARLCRRCTGSPVLTAAGIANDVPHQVTHALVSRMQRIIDRRVDEFTADELPTLHAELSGEELWRTRGYDPAAGLAPEYEGLDPDPEPAEGDQPFLFTLAGLAEETRPEPPLPRPPLSAEEKQRLRREIELADRCAEEAGRELCFALAAHRPRIQTAISRFVEPQVRAMLDELSRNLEPPQ
ncbi:spermidine/putrescine ABC transporter substrate-binding protein [Leucobacter allii]|uniref:Spermidine/putrescine ABC transporter substrate-binding protein n=1 Tax=Leucobacter allii TaxID=2932247 RepID=A0ABY4FP06_9MICO|nr:spermidine/putrescine ABC transporter substrate-binding protein [Leucobacter allii]UOQ57944.1 spermidine/putrescine ABC transporter substrate-binding protein [Leucobacter allii]